MLESKHKSYRDDELPKAENEKADLETQEATHVCKHEATVSKSNGIDAGGARGSQLKIDLKRVDLRKTLANEYLDELKPDCMNSGITHAVRAELKRDASDWLDMDHLSREAHATFANDHAEGSSSGCSSTANSRTAAAQPQQATTAGMAGQAVQGERRGRNEREK